MKLAVILLLAGTCAWAQNSCLECHSALDDSATSPAVLFANDIHREAGFGCVDCHGGDASTDDPDASMSPSRGFRGAVSRTEVPGLCAHCHSDANLIHKFSPRQRVDQFAQYRTSVHGQRLAAGDESVANCVDCHSVHDIRRVRDTQSPVHPLRLPETCAGCHANAEHMAPSGLATAQFEEYRTSVHWQAVSDRGDLSAPSCASCHGNHGATPPEVSSVAAVCGTCHVLLENLYKDSPHMPVFEAMGLGGCVVCHGNHAVLHPTTALLVGEEAVCAQCHDAGSAGGTAAAEMGRMIVDLDSELKRSDEILLEAEHSGMEVSEALLRQTEGRQNLVEARVAVHSFNLDAVREPTDEGFAIAAETHQAGEEALRERGFRRLGLSLALLAILATMAGLWLAIRAIERDPAATSSPAQGGG
jgi:predicted CXXCH cytochrome family protein